jgi:hypothetical protein
MILSAHNAAELTLAAIAEQLRVPELSSLIYLLDYHTKLKSIFIPKIYFLELDSGGN